MLSAFVIAQAAAPAQSTEQSLFPFGMLIVLFVVLYFLLIRPQQKRAKEQKKMIADLAKGDEVIAAGILGRVENVGEHFLILQVADNVQIRVQKGAVSTIVPKGTMKTA